MSLYSLSGLAGARAVVTGHTGFKGAWLSAWLAQVGAEVHGIALPATEPSAHADLGVADLVAEHHVDVRDSVAIDKALASIRPDLVFHLAAQPLVRRSWSDRKTTFDTNVLGTVNVLEAALATRSTQAVVVATTDKVYENVGGDRAFVESDRLGGHDPYSASKAATELALVPYRAAEHMGFRPTPIVSVRAGNVIGGGDYAEDRLVPDLVRALQRGRPVTLRHPEATRPWQHVLDCLWGYLLVAAHVTAGREVSPSYNFARNDGTRTVLDLARAVTRQWGAGDDSIVVEPGEPGREAPLLALDPTLAQQELGWHPAWTFERALAATLEFYRSEDKRSLGKSQLVAYHEQAVDHAVGTGTP